MFRLKKLVRNCKSGLIKMTACMSFLLIQFQAVLAAETWTARTWQSLLDYTSASELIELAPLPMANRKWKLCALYPHLKDSYWLSVNYGMVDQAKNLGVSLKIFEAGGYYHQNRQAEQLEACVQAGSDAILLGTVTHSGHSKRILEISKSIPIFGLVNKVNPEGISGMTGVDWTKMGLLTGRYLEKLHPKDSAPVTLAWFPGAGKKGISSTKMSAFLEALENSSAEAIAVKYGDTGKMVQLTLIEELLEKHKDIDYIVGTGVTAEAAISALKLRGQQDKISVISGYLTHGVYRGIKRGRILFSPTDQPALQGRMSVDQAVRFLEGRDFHPHIGPEILSVTAENVAEFSTSGSLSPSTFHPTFQINAP